MNKEEKGLIIEELVGKISATDFFYIADASGLTVLEINDFRRKCFEAGIEYKVYKNTLIKKALDQVEGDFSALDNVLKGTSGIIFSPESNNAPAKVIKAFRAGGEKPVLKGAYIDSDVFIGDENVEVLSKLKSKAELIGEIVSILQSPAKNVISSLQSGGSKLSGILQTLSEKAE